MNLDRLRDLAGITEAKFNQEFYQKQKAEAMNEVREVLKSFDFKLTKQRREGVDHDGLSGDIKIQKPVDGLDITKKIYNDLSERGWVAGKGEKDDLSIQLVKKNKNINCYVKLMPGHNTVHVYAEEI